MEIQSSTIAKYKKYEKILKVVWYLVLSLGLVLTIVAISLGVLYATDTFPYKSSALKLSAPGIAVSINSELVSPPVFITIMVNALLIWVLILYLLSQFRKIFSTLIINKTPFISENISRIKKMAYSLFKYSVAAFLLACITSPIVNSKNAFAEVKGLEFYADLSIPLWPILFGLLILGIAEIFNHGVKLQEDSESIV